MNYKVCSKCVRILLIDSENFYRDVSKKDGFKTVCKKCGAKYSKEYHRKKYKTKVRKGKVWLDNGYIMKSTGNGKKKGVHRIIAEKVLCRTLKRNEIVHHINGNRSDNRHCNLLICDISYHSWLHWKMSNLYMKEKFK